jgi:hypothetical protein
MMNGGGAVQLEPDDETQDHNNLHQHGTISADGTPLFGNSWGAFIGFGGEIAGFNGVYPSPGFTPAFDPSVSASWAFAAEANRDAATPSSSEVIQATQTSGNVSPSGFVITASYDTTITDLSASDPTVYSGVTAAITAAIDFYEQEITTPITITIDFGYGEIDGQTLGSGDLSESLANYDFVSYTTLKAALASHAESVGLDSVAASLPSRSPSAGGYFYVADAELAALGLSGDISSGRTVDGYVGLSSSQPFTYPPNGRAVSGEYDAIGALEHEISEDMGRVITYGHNNYSALSLFRYTSDGTLATTGNESAYFSVDGGKTNLAEFNNGSNGGDPGDWATSVVDDSYDAFSNPGVANTVSATDLTEMEALGYTLAPACYAAGTCILTTRGEVRVEDLAVGDMVRARFAGLTPIKWIGHRRIDCRRHPDPQQVWPVRVVAGAFAPDQPCRDLLLSPDHAVAVEGALVPIRLLVNGASIRQEAHVQQVHYFHIELDRHDLLLADGLAAESYLDTGNRGMFTNADVPIALHPMPDGPAAQQRRETMSCLKLRGDPGHVEPVWQALAARAKDLGLALPVVATTHDPALCVVVGARRFAPVLREGGRYSFALPALPGGARLQSRCAVPSALRPWLEDRRRLGVMVRHIALRRGTDVVDVAPDDPCLADGWWAAECDDAAPWRWTNGDAALPPTDDFTILEVLIGETPPYPLIEPDPLTQSAGADRMADAHQRDRSVCVPSATNARSAA